MSGISWPALRLLACKGRFRSVHLIDGYLLQSKKTLQKDSTVSPLRLHTTDVISLASIWSLACELLHRVEQVRFKNVGLRDWFRVDLVS
jgi:hypothetical protein